MTQTCAPSQEPGLVPSNPEEPHPTPANACPEDRDLTALSSKDSLGAALTKQGRYSEAATLLSEVLRTRESIGQDSTSPRMLCTMNNLAAALHHQGQLAPAESLHRRVLESDTQTLGISHPSTLIAMHNLAALLVSQAPDGNKDNAKLSEAAELLQRALPLSQQVNGPQNPATLGIMAAQADVLLRQGKYEQAQGLAREVLSLRREVLRAHHPDIPQSMHLLGVALRKSGKVGEADALRREEQALREVEGKETEGSSGGDGLVAMREGRYEEAESIFRAELVTGTA